MLPSLLARDIQQGLQQFLITGFEPSDDFMHGLMSRFVKDQAGWLKGPYLQVGLPFTTGKAGRQFFNNFQTEFPGHSHQEAAWTRLSNQHLADHTLVATGTGSGKTECFLYPVLDHCARTRKAGGADSGGIKVLVIFHQAGENKSPTGNVRLEVREVVVIPKKVLNPAVLLNNVEGITDLLRSVRKTGYRLLFVYRCPGECGRNRTRYLSENFQLSAIVFPINCHDSSEQHPRS